MFSRGWELVNDPYVVKTKHFLLSPGDFIGVITLKHGDPNSLLVVDEHQKIWSVPKDAVAILNEHEWPKWAADFVAETKKAQAKYVTPTGKALGYPRYCDDQANFPGATEADGACVGDHVAESLATAAAERIRVLEGERDSAIKMLAEWCDAIDRNGTGWDDWDEHYKNAAFRPGPLSLRDLSRPDRRLFRP